MQVTLHGSIMKTHEDVDRNSGPHFRATKTWPYRTIETLCRAVEHSVSESHTKLRANRGIYSTALIFDHSVTMTGEYEARVFFKLVT